MGKYWDWYEVEFERVAGSKLKKERIFEILESLHEHVIEASGDLANDRRSSEEAERLAVKNLGSPALIVQAERDQSRWEKLPLWVAGIGLAWIAFWFCLSGDLWSMAMYLPALVIVPVAVFLVSLGKRTSHVWAVGGIVGSIGAIMGVVLCFGWINMGAAGGLGYLPKWHIASVTKNENQRLVEYRQDKVLIGEVWNAFHTGDLAKAKSLTGDEGRWKFPSASRFAGGNHGWYEASSFEECQQAWNRKLEVLLQPVERDIVGLQDQLAAMSDARAFSPKSIWVHNAPSIIGSILAAFGIISACHMFGVWITNLAVRLARRRWSQAI